MSAATTIPRTNVLGVGISVLNLDLAEQAIFQAIEAKKKGYVCVTGVHGVSEAQTDPKFRAILNNAFLCTPDGMPMVWCGKAAGHDHMSRVYGPDLMLRIMENGRQHGVKHFFFGGNTGIAQELQRCFEKRLPGVGIVGTFTPPFRPLNGQEEEELAKEISRLKPDIVWVGLSTPKQERFMAQYLPRLEATVMIGVGAAFDFHCGRVKQAPKWMQRSGLEWAFRLGTEPKRLWKRYLKNNPLFVGRILLQVSGLRKYQLE